MDTDSGLNSASAWAQDMISVDFDDDGIPDFETWASAESDINCAGGAWGAGMDSSLMADSGVMMGDPSMALCANATTGTNPAGSLTIGTSAVLPADSEATLWVEIETAVWASGGFNSYQFQLLRGEDSLIYVDGENPDPFSVTVYAGETLSIEFLHEVGVCSEGVSSDVGVDFWVVPEPATLSLLALGGLAVLRKRRRR